MSKHAFLVSPRFLLVLRNAKKHLPPYPFPVTMSLHGFLITLCKVAFPRMVNRGRPGEHATSSVKDGASVTKGPGHGHLHGHHLLPPFRSRFALHGGSLQSAQWVTRRLLCGRVSDTQSHKRYLQLLSLFSWKLTKGWHTPDTMFHKSKVWVHK